jgi:hypothetical protein
MECDNIQIGYGNILITFHHNDFGSFRQWLKEVECKQSVPEHSTEFHVKSIVVPTPCEGLKLLLSVKELGEFNHMLDVADTELKSLALIKLFNNAG